MGGKSGGGNQYSGGNDNLWNTQSEQVRQSMAMSGEMFDYWRNYAPGYLENTANMVDETNNGVLANRLRNQAAADATTSMGIGLDSATRDMSRYGAEFNPTKASYAARDAGITGALARADAMNKATQYADGLKWARNQDALGQVSGMPGNASQMLGSANSGMSNLASMQNNANSMAAQNAAGYGKLGASLAYGLMKADGGQIKLKDGGRAGSSALGIRLAAGGMPGNPASRTPVQGWRERMAAMPSISGKTTPKPFSHSASAEIRMRLSGSNTITECGSWPGAAWICQSRPDRRTVLPGCSRPVMAKRGHSWPVGA